MLPLEKAKLSLEGLSVGDAFGEKFFGHPEIVQKFPVRPGPQASGAVFSDFVWRFTHLWFAQ